MSAPLCLLPSPMLLVAPSPHLITHPSITNFPPDRSPTHISLFTQIRSLPTVVAFKDGKPINQFIGAMNEAGVRQFLEML